MQKKKMNKYSLKVQFVTVWLDLKIKGAAPTNHISSLFVFSLSWFDTVRYFWRHLNTAEDGWCKRNSPALRRWQTAWAPKKTTHSEGFSSHCRDSHRNLSSVLQHLKVRFFFSRYPHAKYYLFREQTQLTAESSQPCSHSKFDFFISAGHVNCP